MAYYLYAHVLRLKQVHFSAINTLDDTLDIFLTPNVQKRIPCFQKALALCDFIFSLGIVKKTRIETDGRFSQKRNATTCLPDNCVLFCRGTRIRTWDPLLPKQHQSGLIWFHLFLSG